MFTIVIPTYNRKNKLVYLLNLISKQIDYDFKVIIIDNNSTDGSKEIIENFDININITKIFNNQNIGATKSINKAINFVETEWYTIVCDDDEVDFNFTKIINQNIANCEQSIVLFNYKSVDLINNSTSFSNNVFATLNSLDSLIYFFSLKFEVAGISGFVLRKTDLLLKEKYPNGFFADTSFFAEHMLINGVKIISDNIYTRITDLGSESIGIDFYNSCYKLYQQYIAYIYFKNDCKELIKDYGNIKNIVKFHKFNPLLNKAKFIILKLIK